ncbi:MAG: NepR family anti-sigma factor [Alphaproteobacteria bacterium]
MKAVVSKKASGRSKGTLPEGGESRPRRGDAIDSRLRRAYEDVISEPVPDSLLEALPRPSVKPAG